MTSDLNISQQMDGAAQAEQDAKDNEAQAGLQDRLKKSGLLIQGPSMEQYDYVGADREGASFEEVEGGGVNLPNKYAKDRYFAGRRVSDGQVMEKRYDPNGYGAEGHKRIANSYTNTQEGPPPSDYDGLIPLAIEHIQNGGTRQDFDTGHPPEMIAQTFDTLAAVANTQVIADHLRTIPEPEPTEKISDQEDLTLEDLKGDKEWLEASKTLAEYFEFEVDDVTLAEDGLEEMAALYGSMWKMADVWRAVESGDMPEDVQNAYVYMLSTYERVSPWSMDIVQGTVTGLIKDAPLYLIGGGVGTQLFKQAGKVGATRALINMLMKTKGRKIATGTAVGATLGAVEGGAFIGAEEATKQTVSGERDWEKIWSAAQQGAVMTAMFTGPFGALLSEPGRKGIVAAAHTIADMIGRTGSPLKLQGGWVGTPSSKSYNELPTQIDDLGVPMADTGGDDFYSNLYVAAVEKGLIGNKETNPAEYLKLLEARQRKGDFKSYELADSRLAEWLGTQKTVNKEQVADYLWANRPRVNVLLSDELTHVGKGGESFLLKSVPNLRRSAVKTIIKEQYFDTKQVTNASKEQAWQITNRLTGEATITTSPGLYLTNVVHKMTDKLSDDQVVQLMRTYDKDQLLGPPRWGEPIGDRGSATIVKGNNANAYQEMRLFIPYNGVKNSDDIAMSRFGKNLDELTPAEKKRVERIKEYAHSPEQSFREDAHYPLEHNRLVQVRTQELFTPDGNRVLAVNEMQSDMHMALKRSDKETGGGQYVIEDHLGNPLPQPTQQPTEGWIQMTVNRTLQLAEEQGYGKVAFPVDPDMISGIQLWKTEAERIPGVLNFYKKLGQYLQKDKKLAKAWGISSVQLEEVASDVAGSRIPQKMMVITFNPKTGAKAKPIYGVGALSTGAGSSILGGKMVEGDGGNT
jgi:hypothetical protein